MTPEQEQMLSRLEIITLKPRSKMWLKSDDDAQIEEDLPTLLSLVREQARALEEAYYNIENLRADCDRLETKNEGLREALEKAYTHSNALEVENARLKQVLNMPEIQDFTKAVPLEAAHQRERWGQSHDACKEPQDWYWLIGWLAGKAVNAQIASDREKALHHTITAAAALANWHASIKESETQNHD